MKKTNQAKPETIYQCPDNLVTIEKRQSGFRRWPAHSYSCTVYLLKPTPGTRVAPKLNGVIEFMPAMEDLVQMLVAIDPDLKDILPAHLVNKPIKRKKMYDSINQRRHAERRKKW